MKTLRRIGLSIAAVGTALVYVWIAAVRAAPGVRRRKDSTRANRRS